jgi:hypothetical protein
MRNTDQEWFDVMTAKGHSPEMDNGEINMFVYGGNDPYGSGDFCNGPACTTCGWACCEHCSTPESIPDCPGLPVF